MELEGAEFVDESPPRKLDESGFIDSLYEKQHQLDGLG